VWVDELHGCHLAKGAGIIVLCYQFICMLYVPDTGVKRREKEGKREEREEARREEGERNREAC